MIDTRDIQRPFGATPIFARRHYDWLASLLRSEYHEHPKTTEHIVLVMASALGRENPAFDRRKFLDDCGIPDYSGLGRSFAPTKTAARKAAPQSASRSDNPKE